MNLNATLLGQMITFTLFVWFTMKFVWPHIVKAMDERQKKIADGLAAAERGQHDLELAQDRITKQLREAKVQAVDIIDQANNRANQLVEEAKDKAKLEGRRIIEMAQGEIEQARQRLRYEMRKEAVGLAISSAEKILEHDIDSKSHEAMFDKLLTEIED